MIRHVALLLVLVAGFPNLGFAAKKQKEDKKHKPIVFVLKKCKTIDEIDVQSAEGKPGHTEIICECSMRSQKLDAKTGKTIVECE